MPQKSAGYAIAACLSLPARAAAAKEYPQSTDLPEEASSLALAPAGAYRLFPPTTSVTFVYLQENQVTLVTGLNNLDPHLCAWLSITARRRKANDDVERLRSVLWRRR